MTLGALAFLSPWLLTGLLALPIIYWLLRTVPPRPRQVAFPATRILVGLRNQERTPSKTPWWLMLIRLLAAALIILALADPVLNPNRREALTGTGPVVIIVDNTWAAATHWAERRRMVERLIAEAESNSRAVVIVPTAISGQAPRLRIETPKASRSTAAALQPLPFPPVREAVGKALEALIGTEQQASIVWLTDTVDHQAKAGAFSALLARLGGAGFAVYQPGSGREPLAITTSVGKGGRLEAVALRPQGGGRDGVVYAYSQRAQRLGEATFRFAPGETSSTATFDLPLELRNQVVRLEIAGERSAGAVHLLDASSRWHRVGLISGETREQAQPLLAPLYYIARALRPYAELVEPRETNIATALDKILTQNASVVVMADIGTLTGSLRDKIRDWIERGGVLVRFAGPRLEKGGDDLLPVALRLGGRALGGALSWSTPQPLSGFGEDSLFAGLTVPSDVMVNRQVLADPAKLGADVKVWARLKDGTPLVTAVERERGQIVLFHVTANTDWSNLPLSGLFVEMLRRISTLGRFGTTGDAGETTNTEANAAASNVSIDAQRVLAPRQILDGFGALKAPPPTAQAIPAGKFASTKPSAVHPPGYYGAQDNPTALNLLDAQATLKPLPPLPSSAQLRAYEGQVATPLKPSLLAAALALLFADVIAVLLLQMGGSGLTGWRQGRAAAASRGSAGAIVVTALSAGLLATVVRPEPAAAQFEWRPQPFQFPRGFPPSLRQQLEPLEPLQIIRPSRPPSADETKALTATARVTFGYVTTGEARVDEISQQGLSGLVRMLSYRTAVEPAEPVAVDIDTDDIAFFPLLYWPVLASAGPLSAKTLAKIDAYMKEGGLIIFDTKDYGQGLPSGINLQRGGQDGTPLQRLLGRLDIPRLEPVPASHVLTKAFYLLRSFPGRWDGGRLWVEANSGDDASLGRQARRADGVTSILVTSNDFAAAWALDDGNRPLYPVVPGGERQREMAFRTGINIVMHALTGNYKADQVHVPALLDRLGQ